MTFLMVYLLSGLLVAMLGRKRAGGFFGFLLLSLILTPVIGVLALLMGRQRQPC